MNTSRIRMVAMATLASLLSTTAAMAHPGHGVPGDSDSLWHQLTTPSHLMTWVILAAVAWIVMSVARRALPVRKRCAATITIEAGKAGRF